MSRVETAERKRCDGEREKEMTYQMIAHKTNAHACIHIATHKLLKNSSTVHVLKCASISPHVHRSVAWQQLHTHNYT